MSSLDPNAERKLICRIYHRYYYKMHSEVANANVYYANREQWLAAQGCHLGKKVKWDSDEQRVEFMLRWL